MSTSIPPRQSGGGNTKYAIIGILLLLLASVGIYLGMRKPAQPVADNTVHTPPPAVHDAGPEQPVGPTVGTNIELPPEEPDAGPAETGDGGRHIRYVTRYVSACPGRVDGTRVAAVLRTNYGGLRECYNRALRSNPTLRGNATAQWAINPNGSVGQVETAGVVGRDRNFRSCFESALTRLRFPPASGGCAMFQQTFAFTPGGG